MASPVQHAKPQTTTTSATPVIKPQIIEPDNVPGDYVVYRQLKSVRGRPGSRKVICAGHFESREQARQFAARIYAKDLVRKMLVEVL